MSEDKKGPKRKKHRNSKLGCATCKRRRVKCLENLPACTNCLKHRVRCEYLDYTEAQLEEFRRAKLVQQSELDEAEKAEKAEKTEKHSPKLTSDQHDHASEVLELLTIDEKTKLDLMKENELEDAIQEPMLTPPGLQVDADLLYDLPHQEMEPSLPSNLDHHDLHMDDILALPVTPHRHRGGVLDVLNFQLSSITQNFDNLLSNTDGEIIYPIYLIHNTPDVGQRLSRPSTAQQSVVSPLGPFGAVRDVFLHNLHPVPEATFSHRALPHAMQLGRTFSVPKQQPINYEAWLFSVVMELSPQISLGHATLDDIRRLYHIWLCYFIYKGFELSVMFSCLTNLTTNYLITNVFSVSELREFDALVSSTRFRNILVVHLIQHYALVIKQLSSLLNKSGDPEMAALISYILSLMAIYDPEATANSTKCFRDGMFSVLSYTLHLAQKNHVAPPRLIPIHLQLMTNVARTVYLPAYSFSFLFEYEKLLNRFGEILHEVSGTHITNPDTLSFIHREYGKLSLFCLKTLNLYIPEVNKNLDNIEHQESLFFSMFRKWASLQPSRLLMVKKSTDPFEKVLNLFCRLFRKAVFAVMPQVRFFYLRDFDSPLMLDVFVANKDTDVFGELDSPEKLCIDPAVYAKYKDELKLLASYATRVITFLSLRLSILYRNLVYNEKVRNLYPIRNIIEWRSSITDIKRTRDEFHARIGLLENCILSFNDTYITTLHYPQIVDPSEPGARLETPHPPAIDELVGEVDLMSIQPYGLLPLDALPSA